MRNKTMLVILSVLLPFFVSVFVRDAVTGQEIAPAQLRSRRVPNIDMFMANWKDIKSRKVYGTMEVWDILTKLEGDPLRPKRKGAVLTDLNVVSYAIVKAYGSTRPMTLESRQQVYYIVSGKGIIRTEKKTVEIHEEVGILMPPGIEFSMTNTGGEALAMYIIEEPVAPGFSPRKNMIVRYEYENEISTNIRRVNSDNWLFSLEDGLSTLVSFNPIMFEPMSLVPPHVHEPGVEEVWIAVKGELQIQVGSQRRSFPVGSAYKVPANGRTPHSNINNTDSSKKLLWMMKVPLPQGPANGTPQNRKGVI